MKSKKSNNKQIQNKGLCFRPELPGTATTTAPETAAPQPNTASTTSTTSTPSEQPQPARILPYVNYQQREENRALPTEEILDLLRQWLPAAYDLAEIVGRWVWVTFPEQPAEQIRGQLSQFGFHWNNSRKCWQHPCGQFAAEGSAQDPRQKYGSHFPADVKAA
jgi:hypothetical protein